ncbi:MAG: transposase [Candidatus Woesearchaeota archaeon]
MRSKETLKEKAYYLWKKAGLPKFLNHFGPKKTPAWKVYLCYLEYTAHAPAWRRVAGFMEDYHSEKRHWTSWQKAIAKWPQSVWDALKVASIEADECKVGAIDGTTLTRSDASQHYLKRIDREDKVGRPVQEVLLVDIAKRKFLSWRIRATPRGEKCDVPYLIRTCPVQLDGVVMDKGFDSNPLYGFLRDAGIWSVAPVRKGCKRGQYRRQLRDCFDWALYWQRSIIESMISAVKRLFGSHVRARTARMQRAELSMRLIAYNIGAITITTFY